MNFLRDWKRAAAALLAAGILTASPVQTSMAKESATAAASLMTDAAGTAKVDEVYTLLVNGGGPAVVNYSGADYNVNSMAGGVEVLSSFAVSYSTDAAEGTLETVRIPLRQVLSGRTLRDGERLQGIFDAGDHVYTAVDTEASGDSLEIAVPYRSTAANPTVTFCVAKSGWSAGDGYDYLALGNSITLHPKRAFWPNAMGMGATSIDKDYYHQVLKGLSRTKKNVNGAAMNYAIWEISYGDRARILHLLDGYLSSSLDLVSVQLGDNVTNTAGFDGDFRTLLQYIRAKAPNAQIIVTGNYWRDDQLDETKKKIAEEMGISYVSLSALQDNPYYQFGIDTAYDADGKGMYSDNKGTAIHPNNRAMASIAKGILKAVR